MKIPEILNTIEHRPWKLPSGDFSYYQEWNDALFLHWAVTPELISHMIPENLVLDTFKGKAYISLVAFTMQKIRPKYLPSLSFVSDFHEINLRTYVDVGGKKGVYFLNIEAEKLISSFIAKQLSGLPYEKSSIKRGPGTYRSENIRKDFILDAQFEVKETIEKKTELDKWLTERYCLYLDHHQELYRYEIHHREWELKHVQVHHLNVRYKIGILDLSEPPIMAHYSEGVKVLAWKRGKL